MNKLFLLYKSAEQVLHRIVAGSVIDATLPETIEMEMKNPQKRSTGYKWIS